MHEMAGGERTTGQVEVRGAMLAVDVGGAGADVIWGHGLASSMDDEDDLPLVDVGVLRRSHRVVRYDARGHGRSSSTDDLDGYSWRQLALDQLALADLLGIDRYVAAGASMGTGTALHAAVGAPERIRALLLVIPPTAWASRTAQREAYAAGAALIEAGRIDDIVAGMAAVAPPGPFGGDPFWRERAEQRLRSADPVRRARVLRGALGADLPTPAEIAAIEVPVLILAWTGDAAHPTTTAGRLAELLPRAQMHIAATRADLDEWTGRAVRFLADVG